MIIASNLAEPVLLHCRCSQITPENTQFQAEQSESMRQHRHLVAICNYNIFLPPPKLLLLAWDHTECSSDLVPHSWEAKLSVPSVDPQERAALGAPS